MKTKAIILGLIASSSFAFAINSTGTLPTKPGQAISGYSSGTLGGYIGSDQGTMGKINGIVLYQGEAGKDVYFKYGQAMNGQWKIDQFKMEKNVNSDLNKVVEEALRKSQVTRNWQVIRPQRPSAYDAAKTFENDK